MKKLLILAYDFPPYVSVGGLRPYAWYKYFHEFDIYPIVVTRQWENKYGNHLDYIAPSETKETIIEESDIGTIIRTPYKANLANKLMLKYGENKYKFIRKIISALYELFQWIFFVGPKSGLYFGAKKYLKENKVDCIIATGEPFVLFYFAKKLSQKFNIPWIADYRDPWTQSKKRCPNLLLKKTYAYFERKYLKNTSFITTVSNFLAKHISSNLKSSLFYIIPNGFDNEILKITKEVEQNRTVLNIGFVGTIYKWHPFESFLKNIEKFVKERNVEINLNFYGINNEAEIKNIIETKCPIIKSMVNIYSRMPNSDLIADLSKNNALLLFNDYSVMGTKIYDYLAVKRKILLCYTDDEQANLLKERHYNLKEIDGLSNSLQAELIKETNSGRNNKIKNHGKNFKNKKKTNKKISQNHKKENK